jgi:hypothetical protein
MDEERDFDFRFNEDEISMQRDFCIDEAIQRVKYEARELACLWYNRANKYPDKRKRRTRVKCSLKCCQETQDELESADCREWLSRTVRSEQKQTTIIKQFAQFVQHYRQVTSSTSVLFLCILCRDCYHIDYVALFSIINDIVLTSRSFVNDHCE